MSVGIYCYEIKDGYMKNYYIVLQLVLALSGSHFQLLNSLCLVKDN